MNDVYKQISSEIKVSKEMRELAFDIGSEEGFKLRKQQDDLYKRTEFKKNFLKARSKQKKEANCE